MLIQLSLAVILIQFWLRQCFYFWGHSFYLISSLIQFCFPVLPSCCSLQFSLQTCCPC
ncbi:hypothetical protein OIU79_016770 [Salix purpurea]|uniref:Uncharacterized protein n=1 Tax=Salix purpurea TaxID=77065 RepID=A0A9Q0PF64_SALPP|nr:hypothetical protein OIU79_016770 [Salix purpurea]